MPRNRNATFLDLDYDYSELEFAAVLSDWEILRMAGFAFLHWLRTGFNEPRKRQKYGPCPEKQTRIAA